MTIRILEKKQPTTSSSSFKLQEIIETSGNILSPLRSMVNLTHLSRAAHNQITFSLSLALGINKQLQSQTARERERERQSKKRKIKRRSTEQQDEKATWTVS